MTTRFLPLAHHAETGVVLSDTTLRLVTLKQYQDSVIPEQYAELTLPAGCITNGVLTDHNALVSFLKNTRKTYSLETVALVIVSSHIQTFNFSAKAAGALHIREELEKLFGLPAKDIAYDYNTIAADDATTTFHVTAIPKALAQDITVAFHRAGITVLTIEPLAHAVVRDVMPPHTHQTALIIDIDTQVTSLTFVVRGKVAHNVLLAVGDDTFTETMMKTLQVEKEEVERLKREDGLLAHHRTVFNALHDDCAALAHHINETYIQWRTDHPLMPAVETVFLTGAGSTLRGLDDYLSAELRFPVRCVNVWANCLSFDEHIPAIPQALSVRYAAAIGVALVGGDTLNLLPHAHKKALRRKHLARLSGKIFFSFVLGVAVGFAVAKAIAIPSVHAQVMTLLHKFHAQW